MRSLNFVCCGFFLAGILLPLFTVYKMDAEECCAPHHLRLFRLIVCRFGLWPLIPRKFLLSLSRSRSRWVLLVCFSLLDNRTPFSSFFWAAAGRVWGRFSATIYPFSTQHEEHTHARTCTCHE